MTPEPGFLQRAGSKWLNFWFPAPSLHLLASIRIGTGLVFVYALLLRSYDLEAQFSSEILGDPQAMPAAAQMAWRFSLFGWFDGSGWLWTVHIAAIGVGLAFLLGIFPAVSGALSLVFHLSYLHANPAVVVGLDGSITLALAYLTLMPCGRRWTVLWWRNRPAEVPVIRRPAAQNEPPPWHGVVLRALQIHLCLLYFQSGLAKLGAGWLGGVALWHPGLVEKGGAFAPETLQAYPLLLSLVPYVLALFELFFPVFVWIPRLRYVALAAALGIHLSVGLLWEKLPFNLLMLVLVAAFIPPRLVEKLGRWLGGLAGRGESILAPHRAGP